MPWLALDYAARDTEAKISKALQIRGLPTLILMNPQTGEIQEDGRECVGLGADFYPWTAELKVFNECVVLQVSNDDRDRAAEYDDVCLFDPVDPCMTLIVVGVKFDEAHAGTRAG